MSKEIFLLTNPPHNERTKLALRLIEQSENPVLYLTGDGVYNLLESASPGALPKAKIFACREDLEARGLHAGEGSIAPEDFYNLLVEDIVLESSRIYTL
jgi:tRNA 2-thiouridine synthesizing protein B